jgi:RNA polymerase sigma-70 factor (ECF subfamily)
VGGEERRPLVSLTPISGAQQPAPAAGPTDEQLVELALRGQRSAFEQLIRRHQRAVANFVFRQTGQRDGASDLAQEVFLKVYLGLASFDPAFRFKTWLYRIASNCAIDHMRRRGPATCALQPEGEPRAGAALAAEGPTADDLLRLRELQERIETAVGRLPVDLRQLILLRYRQHCRYDEISRIADLPLGTVKNRIFRAREMLRGELADLLGSDA